MAPPGLLPVILAARQSAGSGDAPPAWTPAQLPGLVMWLDPGFGVYQERTGASATTPAAVADDPVGTWAVRAGSAAPAYWTAPSDAARPLLKSPGAAPYLQYDGTNDYLVGPDLFTGLTSAGLAMAVRTDADPNAAEAKTGFVKLGASANADHYPFTDNGVYSSVFSTTRHAFGNLAALDVWHTLQTASAAGAYSAYRNNVSVFSTGSNTYGSLAAPRLGSSTDSYFYAGRMGDVIVCAAPLSAGDRALVQSYLAAKYSIT